MPYTEEELRDNLHYQSLKERDEIKYEQKFQKDLSKFLTKEGSTEETKNKILKTSLRDSNGVIRIFENFSNGETFSNLSVCSWILGKFSADKLLRSDCANKKFSLSIFNSLLTE